MAEVLSKIPKSTVIKMSDSFEFTVSNKPKRQKRREMDKKEATRICVNLTKR